MLVDEYQDCNPLQRALVEELQGDRRQVTIVGDDAQSIYRFRGAHPDAFKLFKVGAQAWMFVCLSAVSEGRTRTPSSAHWTGVTLDRVTL